MVRVVRRHQTGITEPPKLTSDSVCTADRSDGILISFGPNRNVWGCINPSTSWSGPHIIGMNLIKQIDSANQVNTRRPGTSPRITTNGSGT
jgi:hypothetical protein